MIASPNIIATIVKQVWTFLGSYPFLLCAVTLSCALKLCFSVFLLKRGIRDNGVNIALLLLLLILTGGIFEDLAWIVTLTKHLFIPTLDGKIVLFFARVGWAFFIVRYQALALFIENLPEKKFRLRIYQLPFLFISGTLFGLLIGLIFVYFSSRPPLQSNLFGVTSFYLLIPLMLTSLGITFWKLHFRQIPKLIRRQLNILIRFLIVPAVLLDIIQYYPFSSLVFNANEFSVVGVSTIIMTCAIFYSARRIMGLRFLNLSGHVMSPKRFEFINDFKSVIEQFALVTSRRELLHITNNFFKNAFNIPTRRTHLYIRGLCHPHSEKNSLHIDSEQKTAEAFIEARGTFLKEKKILITDEIALTNFYKENKDHKISLAFLTNINADLFMPVYNKNTLTGYIIVERHARTNSNSEFYSNVERDQMVIFATYLGNIINLLQSKNLDLLVAQEKELREELYSKHQKLNQYQESIRSFLRTGKEKKIGIIFYKNRRFTFGNQTAQELVQININTHAGHPTTKALKRICLHALEYRTQQTSAAHDSTGKKIVLTAIPSADQNNVIICLYYPDISDVLKKKVDVLNDPTTWDYLLYLETTKSGKLIDKLIPGTGEQVLNFKIKLLKAALCKQAVLLDAPHEDLLSTVELLHHISLRDTLHVLTLHGPSNSSETAIKIFGANPIFGLDTKEKPLLEKLNGIGTLFIQNVHFLDLEVQKQLAQFIKYGSYCRFKTDQQIASDVRIICSTNRDLYAMTQEGTFSKELFAELSKTTLIMPSFVTLPEDELQNLVAGLTDQALQNDTLKNILELSDREKRNIAHARPASLHELKKRVQQLLEKKSQDSDIHEEAQFDAAYGISDPELAEAICLGKHALRDRKLMSMLWKKFKNQNKIATLLGVNRSSVNRRCKEYDLI